MKTYKRGLLPLSGDPITWGHLDLIRRAGLQCDILLVAILNNPGKNGYVFSDTERVDYASKAIRDFCPDVKATVLSSEESMVNMFLLHGCDVVFRGVRDEQDREYEKQQLFYHEMVLPGITAKTVILEADPALKYVQSTVARNFAVEHLDATQLTPMFIQARLWRSIHKQKMFGVTGSPGIGKTTLIQATLEAIRENGLPVYHINLGAMLEDLLKLRFADYPAGKTIPKELVPLVLAHLGREYRDALKGKPGIVLVEYSYLAEDGLLGWVNNNVIVVSRPKYEESVLLRPLGDCWSTQDKAKVCQEKSDKDKYGLVLNFEHEENNFAKGLGGVIVAKVRSGM